MKRNCHFIWKQKASTILSRPNSEREVFLGSTEHLEFFAGHLIEFNRKFAGHVRRISHTLAQHGSPLCYQ